MGAYDQVELLVMTISGSPRSFYGFIVVKDFKQRFGLVQVFRITGRQIDDGFLPVFRCLHRSDDNRVFIVGR